MKLYYAETPNARKPCAVAKYLDIPMQCTHINLNDGEHQKPEFLALNPNAKIPVLQDGATVIWESSAIMMYLAQLKDSSLWPSTPVEQVDVHRWLSWDNAHFSRHAGTLMYENYVKSVFRLGEVDAAVVREATSFFRRFAEVLDRHLTGRQYVSGTKLTIADFALSSLLPSSADAGIPLNGFNEIKRWYDGLMEIPAIRDPWPENASS